MSRINQFSLKKKFPLKFISLNFKFRSKNNQTNNPNSSIFSTFPHRSTKAQTQQSHFWNRGKKQVSAKFIFLSQQKGIAIAKCWFRLILFNFQISKVHFFLSLEMKHYPQKWCSCPKFEEFDEKIFSALSLYLAKIELNLISK